MSDEIHQLHELAASVKTLLAPQRRTEAQLRQLLNTYAPEKKFKAMEYVGDLGEVYAKLLFGGVLENESHEHDLTDSNGRRVSVKTRRGKAPGWTKTSAIPTINDKDGPQDLVFVSLNDDYTPRRVWRYEWETLRENGRFKEHSVRGERRSFVFFVSEDTDAEYIRYEAPITQTAHEMDEAPDLVTIDLAKVRAYLYGPETPAYRTMHEMNRVLTEEGMEGHRGAPRALLAFVDELVEHCQSSPNQPASAG